MGSDSADLKIVKKPRLRWFQFRLRTMFVVTTLFALWFGNEMNFIHERIAMLDQVVAAGGSVENDDFWYIPMGDVVRPSSNPAGDDMTALRRWLGDRRADTIYLPHEFLEGDQQRVVDLFPSSRIVREPDAAEVRRINESLKRKLIWDLDGRHF